MPSEPDVKVNGSRIRQIRAKMGLTRQVLAELTELEVGDIKRVERGTCLESEKLGAIASALNMPKEALLSDGAPDARPARRRHSSCESCKNNPASNAADCGRKVRDNKILNTDFPLFKLTPPSNCPKSSSSDELRECDFDYIRKLVRHVAGIFIKAHKRYLVERALNELVKVTSFDNGRDIVDAIHNDPFAPLTDKLVEKITTNESLFFRDEYPFDALANDLLPELYDNRRRQIRIWSAACSTGQEPYSIAMTVAEESPSKLSDTRILASDISADALQQAESGQFNKVEIKRGLPETYRERYFDKKLSGKWEISNRLKNRIDFRKLNLTNHFESTVQTQDIVFLRYVLCYFNEEVKDNILSRIRRVMPKDGYLIVGGSEGRHNFHDDFESASDIANGIYRPTT